MIHSMKDCRAKLEVIKVISEQGVADAREIDEIYKFEQILQEANYLLNESHPDNDK